MRFRSSTLQNAGPILGINGNEIVDDLDLLEELEDELSDFKRSRKYKKLTVEQWVDLNNQYVRTPEIDRVSKDTQFYPAGEHVILRSILNSFGYFPIDRADCMNMAYDLIIMGYE